MQPGWTSISKQVKIKINTLRSPHLLSLQVRAESQQRPWQGKLQPTPMLEPLVALGGVVRGDRIRRDPIDATL